MFFINSTKFMLINSMMIGVIISICSNNWISLWIGMEISMLSFIPLMMSSKITSSQSMIQYFIIQSLASTMFLYSIITMLIGVNMMMNEMLMVISMLIKIGIAPFHNWVLIVIESIEYFVMIFLLTVMKLPPLTAMYQISSSMLMTPMMISFIMSSISSLNQSSLRKMLGFSSIYNMTLIISSISTMKISLIFMLIYSTNMIFLIMTIESMKINFINQFVFNEFTLWVKMNLWINMLSMAGFPPLMGFISKMIIIQKLISFNEILLVSLIMLTSLLILMFYTRLVFSSMMISNTFKKWTLNFNKPFHFIMISNLFITFSLLAMNCML
uniref:NADH dehydrogenase subunit 2 n=1 Tax=Nephotettix nigropictus TaxID=1563985 RepID=UPI0021D53852|nr:NADH dehydrogenase subunit 2 [Nephotettix nigropictus]UXD78678.1 NADH dehydrogenase subunit 2 [Nephotettix nigropictus]